MVRVVRGHASLHVGNVCAEIDNGVMRAEWPGRAVELAGRTLCVLVLVDHFPASTRMLLRYAVCVCVGGRSH